MQRVKSPTSSTTISLMTPLKSWSTKDPTQDAINFLLCCGGKSCPKASLWDSLARLLRKNSLTKVKYFLTSCCMCMGGLSKYSQLTSSQWNIMKCITKGPFPSALQHPKSKLKWSSTQFPHTTESALKKTPCSTSRIWISLRRPQIKTITSSSTNLEKFCGGMQSWTQQSQKTRTGDSWFLTFCTTKACRSMNNRSGTQASWKGSFW